MNAKRYKFNEKTLQYEQVGRNFTLPIMVAAVFLALGFSSAVKVNTIMEKIPIVMRPAVDEDELTPENVKKYIKEINLRFPDIVYQQVMWESGHLKSPFTKQLKNITGMQIATMRSTLGANTGLQFASYKTWKECLIDYALWQEAYTKDIKNKDEYYWFLDKIYCEKDPSVPGKYSDHLKQMPTI